MSSHIKSSSKKRERSNTREPDQDERKRRQKRLTKCRTQQRDEKEEPRRETRSRSVEPPTKTNVPEAVAKSPALSPQQEDSYDEESDASEGAVDLPPSQKQFVTNTTPMSDTELEEALRAMREDTPNKPTVPNPFPSLTSTVAPKRHVPPKDSEYNSPSIVPKSAHLGRGAVEILASIDVTLQKIYSLHREQNSKMEAVLRELISLKDRTRALQERGEEQYRPVSPPMIGERPPSVYKDPKENLRGDASPSPVQGPKRRDPKDM